MIRNTIALTVAVSVAAGTTMALADNADTYYALSNPRIIQVPQRGETLRDSHASLRDDDDDVAPAKKTPRREPKTATQKEPARRKPFSVVLPAPPPPEPEPTGPRRALLSAPPPLPTSSIHDGPTPLRPTPRFGQPLPDPAPEPLTTFTPPPPSIPAPTVAAHQGDDDNEDHLPPPGDPRLAPPEPAQ